MPPIENGNLGIDVMLITKQLLLKLGWYEARNSGFTMSKQVQVY